MNPEDLVEMLGQHDPNAKCMCGHTHSEEACEHCGCVSFEPVPEGLGPKEAKFWTFHHENPQVYDELTRLARKARSQGRHRLGIRMLWEVTRWNLTIETTSNDFKLNDHYHSRYARLIMKREPDLSGVFELRELKSA